MQRERAHSYGNDPNHSSNHELPCSRSWLFRRCNTGLGTRDVFSTHRECAQFAEDSAIFEGLRQIGVFSCFETVFWSLPCDLLQPLIRRLGAWFISTQSVSQVGGWPVTAPPEPSNIGAQKAVALFLGRPFDTTRIGASALLWDASCWIVFMFRLCACLAGGRVAS